MPMIDLRMVTETTLWQWQERTRTALPKAKSLPSGGHFLDLEEIVNSSDIPSDLDFTFPSDMPFKDAIREIIDEWWPQSNAYKPGSTPPYRRILVWSPSVPDLSQNDPRTLHELGFASGDIIVLEGWKPPLAIAAGRPHPKYFAKDLDHFFSAVIPALVKVPQLRDWDGKYNPSPVGALVLYTDEDLDLATYVRQYYAALHIMSGFDLTLYFLEYFPPAKGLERQAVRSFWTRALPDALIDPWNAFGLTRSKPYPTEGVYKIANEIGVSPDRLPCLVLFHDHRRVKDDRLVVSITAPIPEFFRRLCADVHRAVEREKATPSERQGVFAFLKRKSFSFATFKNVFPSSWSTVRHQFGHTRSASGDEISELPRLFMCHTSVDKPFVERLARDLRKLGLNIWLDKWEIQVGDSIIEKLEEGLSINDYLLIVLSPEAIASAWVRRELNAGVMRELDERRVVILPVLYRRTDVPLLIKDKLYADFTVRYSDGLRALLQRLAPDAVELLDAVKSVETATEPETPTP